MNLYQAIFKNELARRTAILYEQRQISYAELRDQTLAVARGLRALGVERGDRVALLLNDSPEFIAAFVSICSNGAVAVPINMGLRLEEQSAILNNCTASIAMVEEDVSKALLEIESELSHLRKVVVVGRDENKQQERPQTSLISKLTLAELLSQSRPQPPAAFPSPDENQPAFILYTSGSTGEPKGAVHSQSDIFYTNETYCREVLRLRGDDRLFPSSRLPFAYGLGNALTFPLLNGCTSVLCREKPGPDVVARVLREHRPTIFFGVPVVYRMLLEHHRNVSPLDTSSLRFCVSAGEALPAQLGEDWQKTFGVEVLDGIGSTEMLHMWMSNHSGDVRYGSSGKLLNGYEAKLVDHEAAPVPDGTEGNLWIRGGSAASRYWQRPETSAQTFVDGWVRTGDLYRCDEQGFWWHMGRSDDCFKPTGQWVSPVEVEGVLVKSDRIRAAAVVEGFDKDGLSCVCAFIVRAHDTDSEHTVEHSLRALCETALPRFKQPRRYIFVPELPYTATGKVQRYKLREQLRSPRSKVQRRHSDS